MSKKEKECHEFKGPIFKVNQRFRDDRRIDGSVRIGYQTHIDGAMICSADWEAVLNCAIDQTRRELLHAVRTGWVQGEARFDIDYHAVAMMRDFEVALQRIEDSARSMTPYGYDDGNHLRAIIETIHGFRDLYFLREVGPIRREPDSRSFSVSTEGFSV